MVLRQQWALALFLALGAVGCLQRSAPPVLAPSGTVVAVAYVRDDVHKRGVVADVPEAVKQRVAEVLAKRNLQVRVVPYAQTAVEFAKVTDSQLRYATLMAQAPEARLYLLVETRVSYFSDVSGRFSWEVHVRTTAGRASASMEPSGTQQEYGAALQFSHQREDEAQTEVARQIAGQAAGLFDSFLASPLAAPVTDGGPAVRPGLDVPDGGNGGGPELGG